MKPLWVIAISSIGIAIAGAMLVALGKKEDEKEDLLKRTKYEEYKINPHILKPGMGFKDFDMIPIELMK